MQHMGLIGLQADLRHTDWTVIEGTKHPVDSTVLGARL